MLNMILRRKDVEKVTGLSRSSIYAAIAMGSFPKPFKIGARAVGWQESDIEKWLSERPIADISVRSEPLNAGVNK